MNFAIQLPDVPVGFRTTTGFSKSRGDLRCCQCDTMTAWFHDADLLYFCSDECYWRFHFAAERRYEQRAKLTVASFQGDA
jgi:hypothetical protein